MDTRQLIYEALPLIEAGVTLACIFYGGYEFGGALKGRPKFDRRRFTLSLVMWGTAVYIIVSDLHAGIVEWMSTFIPQLVVDVLLSAVAVVVSVLGFWVSWRERTKVTASE
jgi:hypothetical protein